MRVYTPTGILYTLAREPRTHIGKESEEDLWEFLLQREHLPQSVFAWPWGLDCKVWGVCELQASNLSCNLPSLIHSMRRTICCHKKERLREVLGIKYVLMFRCSAAQGHISQCFMMCCWISASGESGGCWLAKTVRPYLLKRDALFYIRCHRRVYFVLAVGIPILTVQPSASCNGSTYRA